VICTVVEFAGAPEAAHLVIQSAMLKIFLPVPFLCPSMEKNDDDSSSVFELHGMIKERWLHKQFDVDVLENSFS